MVTADVAVWMEFDLAPIDQTNEFGISSSSIQYSGGEHG